MSGKRSCIGDVVFPLRKGDCAFPIFQAARDVVYVHAIVNQLPFDAVNIQLLKTVSWQFQKVASVVEENPACFATAFVLWRFLCDVASRVNIKFSVFHWERRVRSS